MTILTIAGSPSANSRSAGLIDWVERRLARDGQRVERLVVRDLPAEELLLARTSHPAIRAALQQVDRASAVVIATPVYKAAYSGLLKTFLDLLPQYGLSGKAVLPLASGGSLAHALAIDYALRPVLASLGAQTIVTGVFVEDKLLQVDTEFGAVSVANDIELKLAEGLARLRHAIRDEPPSRALRAAELVSHL